MNISAPFIMAWSRAYIGAGALILVCWQHMLLEKLHHSPFCVSSIMDSDSESTLSSGMHSMPAPTFVPTSVMVLSLTASVYEHTIDIKATSMGANVVAVVQHPKPKSLDMDTLNHMVKKAAVKNGWITVLDGVKLLGKHKPCALGGHIFVALGKMEISLGQGACSEKDQAQVQS